MGQVLFISDGPNNPRLLSAMVASRPAAGNSRVTLRSNGEPTNSRDASIGMVEAEAAELLDFTGVAVGRNGVSQSATPDYARRRLAALGTH
jgi:hypothetical protein